MAEDKPVTAVNGIGAKTQALLAAVGIHTVGQLANAPAECYSKVPKMSSFVQKAKLMVSDPPATEKPVAAGVVFSMTEKKESPKELPKEAPKESPSPPKDFRLVISDHTWWEAEVMIADDDAGEVRLRRGIIYDLCVDPQERIAFICEWINEEETEVCEMTYSPQFLFHFNMTLPPLEITMRPEDIDMIPNASKWTLENTIKEINLTKRASY
jgi:hypothetical protein